MFAKILKSNERATGEGERYMRAQVDQETCIGCGLCPEICPEVFQMEGEKAIAYVDIVPAAVEAQCEQAADECPVAAITVER